MALGAFGAVDLFEVIAMLTPHRLVCSCEQLLEFDPHRGWPKRCPGCRRRVLAPLPGPQTMAMATRAQDVLMGGGVFGGKSTWAALETRRLFRRHNATMLVLRLHRAAMTGGGGLFEKFLELYHSELARGEAIPRASNQALDLRFPRYGSSISFDGFDQDKRFAKFEGGEYSLIIWDEAQQLSWKKFNLIRQRNRSPGDCDVEPRFLMTCNPPEEGDDGFWLRGFIDWYLGAEGNPIPERMGAVRYYTVENDTPVWVDGDWVDEDGNPPRSFTFVQSLATDNPVGLAANPGYLSTLRAQTEVEQARKLRGNWDARDGHSMFGRGVIRWVRPTELPAGFLEGLKQIRYWDQGLIGEGVEQRADHCPTASARGALALCPVCHGHRFVGPDPCGLCNADMLISRELAAEMGPREGLWITDLLEQYGTASEIERLHKTCADQDGPAVPVAIEIEQGSAGVGNLNNYVTKVLPGYEVIGDRPTGKKPHRARPWAALAEHGLLFAISSPAYDQLLRSAMRTFTPQGNGAHIDVIDAVSGLLKVQLEYEWPGEFAWVL